MADTMNGIRDIGHNKRKDCKVGSVIRVIECGIPQVLRYINNGKTTSQSYSFSTKLQLILHQINNMQAAPYWNTIFEIFHLA